MRKFVLSALLLSLILILNGCRTVQKVEKIDYNKPLLPGESALVKLSNPEEIPDFTTACGNLWSLEQAINNSLDYMAKPSSEKHFPICQISHSDIVNSLKEFRQLIRNGTNPEQMNRAIREKFDVYMSVGCDKRGTVLYTGYYTPIFNGSLKYSEKYKYPLYKAPDDLVKNEAGETIGRRISKDAPLTKYPSRAELERSGVLKGNELVWLADPFEVYIAHVQGSAKIRLENGKLITVGYAANNGHEYKSISKALTGEGKISLDKMSLSSMIKYFKAHPEEVAPYVNRNPRFIFFRTSDTNPTGSINEPVIAMRTIATDKAIFPRASLCFLDTSIPRKIGEQIDILPYQGFVLDQDTGGAIRAAGRCDIYMGQGDQAGLVAGKTYQEGRLYYLILKK